MMKESWIIEKRLSNEELSENIASLNSQFAGSYYRHKNGKVYKIIYFTILNHNGIGEYAVCYRDVNAQVYVPHTRPAREFFDGRFVNIREERL